MPTSKMYTTTSHLGLRGQDRENLETRRAVRYYLFTHVHFDVAYNEDKVVEINVSTDPLRTVDITEGDVADVEFSYSVRWKETHIPFERRMEKYSRYSFLPQHLEIHWFSIINSCVTVLLLTGFLATILMRVLKNDFIKYSRDDEQTLEEQEETGWKYIHGDVFRFPRYTSLFCAVIGTGTQLFAMTMGVFALALVGAFYPYNRGALLTAIIVIYALTSGIAGYVAANHYRQMGGENWVRNVFSPVFVLWPDVHRVFVPEHRRHRVQALPRFLGTICIIFVIWASSLPAHRPRGIAGKTPRGLQRACRTTKYPREIPASPWYRGALPQMCMAGFLPFSAIYIELYYIFASVWGHKVYTIYSILFIVFIILIIVTAFITIALTYFQLAVEDHEWWWRAVLCGGSTGVFIYGYCFYYYYGAALAEFMQTSFSSGTGHLLRLLTDAGERRVPRVQALRHAHLQGDQVRVRGFFECEVLKRRFFLSRRRASSTCTTEQTTRDAGFFERSWATTYLYRATHAVLGFFATATG